MMISEEPVPNGKDFTFTMHLPVVITGRESIQFKAHSLWCKKDINPDFYVSGYTIKDIDPVGGGSSPRELTAVNGTLFFSADDGVHGEELWKSDGTAEGTVLVKDIFPVWVPGGPIN